MPAHGPIGTGIPLDFGPFEHVPVFGGPSGGPTVYNQAVSGALSFTGTAPLFSMQRSLAGALSFSGGLTRVFTGLRTLTGALTFSGAAPLAAIQRKLAAAITPTGVLIRRTSRALAGALTPTGALTTGRLYARALAAAALSFIGGANLYPDPNLYPGPDIYPYGGAILYQLNRALTGILQPTAGFLTHAAQARTFTAVLQPQVLFLKTSARVFLSAQLATASLIAVRSSHTVAKALFAGLRNAGSLSSILDPGTHDQGGGGYGVPMPDSFFQRYQPTLRRQKVKV